MAIMFLLVAILFLLSTWGVCYYINLLTKVDTIDYDMGSLWEEMEFSKEDYEHYR